MQTSAKKSLPFALRLAILSLTLMLVACSDSSSVNDGNNNNPGATDNNSVEPIAGENDSTNTSDNNVTDGADSNTDNATEQTSGTNENSDTTSSNETTSDTDTANTDADNNSTNAPVTTNPDPIASLAPIALSPMPSSALTPAPSAADEPIPISGPVSTVTEYFLVRDGGGPIPDDTTGAWTLADFEAGLPEPRITVPSGVNTTTNPAPFFEGLANQTVFAGDTLSILLRPTDSDGTAPGMFPEFIPSDSQYIDNFNRTKTLRWTPLPTRRWYSRDEVYGG